jgi:hypothetical protein
MRAGQTILANPAVVRIGIIALGLGRRKPFLTMPSYECRVPQCSESDSGGQDVNGRTNCPTNHGSTGPIISAAVRTVITDIWGLCSCSPQRRPQVRALYPKFSCLRVVGAAGSDRSVRRNTDRSPS